MGSGKASSDTIQIVRNESGMVQWLRVGARDRDIWVRFPVPTVIFDLVVICHLKSKDPPLPFRKE